jgi:hypothetical protein
MHGELDKQKAMARYIQMMQGAGTGAPTSMSFGDGGEVGEGIASLRPSETSMGLSPYGVRNSGEGLKGKGYFGEIQSPSGQSVTEYSLYDEDIGEYPSIVPTLTAEELQDTIRLQLVVLRNNQCNQCNHQCNHQCNQCKRLDTTC